MTIAHTYSILHSCISIHIQLFFRLLSDALCETLLYHGCWIEPSLLLIRFLRPLTVLVDAILNAWDVALPLARQVMERIMLAKDSTGKTNVLAIERLGTGRVQLHNHDSLPLHVRSQWRACWWERSYTNKEIP